MKHWLLIIILLSTFLFSCSSDNDNPVDSSSSGERIGAVCRDGTTSTATGSGACSHHGGVDHWIYR